MPTKLSVDAADKSTFVVTVSFTDEAGTAVVPATVAWSLYNEDGETVNNRTDVALTPAASVDIVLSGDDLARSAGKKRTLVVEGTYDSDAGSGLPLRDQATFNVVDLVGV